MGYKKTPAWVQAILVIMHAVRKRWQWIFKGRINDV